MIGVTRSQLAEAWLEHKGQAFSLKGWEYFIPVYNCKKRKVILRCGRQVAKSVTAANLIIIDSCRTSYFNSLYVSPSSIQTHQFSAEKLRPTLENSSIIKDYFLKPGDYRRQTYQLPLANGSFIFMRYAYMNAERCRGIPANRICIDEVQDILTSNIPVIEEAAFAAPEKYFLYSGTPKTLNAAIEYYWELSDQREWMPKCEHCGKYNYIDMENIGKEGLICRYCKKSLNAQKGEWVMYGDPDSEWAGFRINQLIMPIVVWSDILQKLRNYPTSKFYNEVLALPYEHASQPVTKQNIIDCCEPTVGNMTNPTPMALSMSNYAGIDWGGGGEDEVSRTVLTIGCHNAGSFQVLFSKIYLGAESDPEKEIEDIVYHLNLFNVLVVGADYGGGNVRIPMLRSRFCPDENKVFPIEYSGMLKDLYKWKKEINVYVVNRTELMSKVFSAIKARNKMRFFRWGDFEPFADDILNVYIDYTQSRAISKLFFNHKPDMPDDFMHSLVYCYFMGQMYQNMPL